MIHSFRSSIKSVSKKHPDPVFREKIESKLNQINNLGRREYK